MMVSTASTFAALPKDRSINGRIFRMLPYAGRTHAKILDALDTQISDEEWNEIEASAQPINARPTGPLGTHFPGWHGITELGW
jgi:hypothetical protein